MAPFPQSHIAAFNEFFEGVSAAGLTGRVNEGPLFFSEFQVDTLLLILNVRLCKFEKSMYSQTCVQRPLLGHEKSGSLIEVL
jgi:hypothetical protein